MRLSQAMKLFTEHSSVERSESTTRGYQGILMQFCRYMHDPPIMQVTPEHVTNYIRESLALGWKKNALVPQSIALRKLFEYWGRKKYAVLDHRLLPVVHKEGSIPKVATPDAVEKLLKQCEGDDICDVRNRSIVLLLIDTGMRNGELCSMNIDIKTQREENDGQYSYIVRTKKNRGSKPLRRVFWYEDANKALDKWIRVRAKFDKMFGLGDPDALFVGLNNSHGAMGKRMTNFTVGLLLRRLSEQAGIPTVNAHSIRHLFGNTAADQGLNNSNISDLMGHASLNSSYVYTHLRGKQLNNAHRKVRPKVKVKRK